MKRQLLYLLVLVFFPILTASAINRDPNGVNVNSSGATTVFITFGGLNNQVPVEAFWCGELTPAAPDIGFKCDPSTIFGVLPIRFDQSRSSGQTGFTDIMSIPPSVARRAYQAAQEGSTSSFFYVRRFVSTIGGPDEFVFVTCRMAGGGARVPFSLVDVRLAFDVDQTVLSVKEGQRPPSLNAGIVYNGTGRLKGRWEVVKPGEEPPQERDLLTEATLPVEERPLQRRYTELDRFNVFLPPTGKYVLRGPDASRLPNDVSGLYQILLRIEASDDKEADSSLDRAGAGTGIVHSGAVAGFPLPVLRYYVGSAGTDRVLLSNELQQLLPLDRAVFAPDRAIDFSWVENLSAAFYQLEVRNSQQQTVLSAILQPGAGVYRAPAWMKDKASDGYFTWRITAIDPTGKETASTEWRTIKISN
jgi:hypothetical protein